VYKLLAQLPLDYVPAEVESELKELLGEDTENYEVFKVRLQKGGGEGGGKRGYKYKHCTISMSR
jgi:hypothetical protein